MDLALNNLQRLICHKTKLNHIYLIYMYKEDLALNNVQGLISHKTKPNQTKPNPTQLNPTKPNQMYHYFPDITKFSVIIFQTVSFFFFISNWHVIIQTINWRSPQTTCQTRSLLTSYVSYLLKASRSWYHLLPFTTLFVWHGAISKHLKYLWRSFLLKNQKFQINSFLCV